MIDSGNFGALILVLSESEQVISDCCSTDAKLVVDAVLFTVSLGILNWGTNIGAFRYRLNIDGALMDLSNIWIFSGTVGVHNLMSSKSYMDIERVMVVGLNTDNGETCSGTAGARSIIGFTGVSSMGNSVNGINAEAFR